MVLTNNINLYPSLIITLPPADVNVKFCVAKVVFMTGAFKVALIFALPTTCKVLPGVVVPMPTLPERVAK